MFKAKTRQANICSNARRKSIVSGGREYAPSCDGARARTALALLEVQLDCNSLNVLRWAVLGLEEGTRAVFESSNVCHLL